MTISLVTQRVWINDTEVWVHDTAIEEALGEAGRISFVFDADANPGIPLPEENDSIVVEQVCDGTQTYQGTVETVHLERGENYTRCVVEARGLAGRAMGKRFLSSWEVPISASTLVREAWEQYGIDGVTLGGIDNGAPAIEQYISTYDSLFDLTDYAANTVGWAWKIDDGVLHFFDPALNTQGNVVQTDFARGTLSIGRSLDQVANIARQQAYIYRNIDTSTPQSTGCVFAARLPADLDLNAWELDIAFVAEGVPVDPETTAFLIDVTLDDRDRVLRLSEPLVPDTGNKGPFAGQTAPWRVRARFRQLVWVERSRLDSIALYGERAAPPLSDDGATSTDEAGRRLEDYLERHAFPPVEIKGEVLRSDIRPGEARRFMLQDPLLDRVLIISRCRRTMSGTELQVEIEATSVDVPGLGSGAGVMGPRLATEPMPEVVRRIERLERRNMNPTAQAGRFAEALGPVLDGPAVVGMWSWAGSFEVAIASPEIAMGDEL